MSRWTSPAAWAASKRARDLLDDPGRLPRVQRALVVDHRPQVGAADVVHRDVHLAVLVAGAVDHHDVRVADRGGQAPLAPEAGAEVLVPGQLRGDDLDRHLAVQVEVDRPVDDAHPAPPDDLLYAVSGEFRAGAQVRHGTIIASRDGCRQPPVRSSAHGRGSPARGPPWAPDRVLRPARAGRRRGGGDRARRRAQAEGAAEHRRRLRPRPPERLSGQAGQPEPVRAVRRPRGGRRARPAGTCASRTAA